MLLAHVLSSSLHRYVLGSAGLVDTMSLVSKPEPHVLMVASTSLEDLKLYTTSGDWSCSQHSQKRQAKHEPS